MAAATDQAMAEELHQAAAKPSPEGLARTGSAEHENSKSMHISVKLLGDAEPLKLVVSPKDTVCNIKSLLQESLGTAPREQKLLYRKHPLDHEEKTLDECGIAEGSMLLLLIVEVPLEERNLTIWDVDGNPRHDQLTGADNKLSCPDLKQDYIAVVTKEPIRDGSHYFQFDVHIEDEGWCGVTPDPNQAATNPYPSNLQGWIYYCGRMGSSAGGGLQFANEKRRRAAKKSRPSGDVVGMAIDFHSSKIVFDVNGVCQGGGNIPNEPMWIIACVDRPVDKYVVNKLPISEIPAESLEELEASPDVDIQLNAERQLETESDDSSEF